MANPFNFYSSPQQQNDPLNLQDILYGVGDPQQAQAAPATAPPFSGLSGVGSLHDALFGASPSQPFAMPAAQPQASTQPQPPAQPQLQGFAAHVANPDNLRAIAPSLAPPTSVVSNQKPPNFWDANTQWFQPSPQTQQDQAELRRLQNAGSGASQVQNPFLHALARIGDVALSTAMPNLAANVPGTTAHNQQLQARRQQRIGSDIQQDQQQLQNYSTNLENQEKQAQTQHLQAQTSQMPVLAQAKQQALLQQGSEHGLKPVFDENGAQTGWEPDEESPVFKKQQAAVQVMESQQELKNAQAELAKSKNDPNSPAYRQASQRLAIAQQNANAAQTRATAYYGNYLEGAFNRDNHGNILPGATTIFDEGGNPTVVGTRNASTAVKAQSNAAQFKDVYGALDSADKAAENLVRGGGKLNSPAVIQAFKQPAGTIGQYLQGELVNGRLSPQERDYVTALSAAHENVQAMRKAAGGSATDSSVAKLDALIPGPTTPDLDYFKRQTKQIRNTADRLGLGVSSAAGGLKPRGAGALGTPITPAPAGGAPSQGTVTMRAPNGQTTTVPAAMVQHYQSLGAQVIQ